MGSKTKTLSFFFAFIFVFSFPFKINAQTSTSKIAQKYLKQAIKIARTESLFRDSLDWIKVETTMFELAKGAQKTKDCYVSMNYLISALREHGDTQSRFYPPMQNVKNKIENLDGREPIGKYLGNAIGYIEVPGFISINQKIMNSFASKIQNIIKSIDSTNEVKNWVIDLRENTGGNMYAMIAGLGPIIGEGTCGYFHNVNDKKPHAWKYLNGEIIVQQKVLCKVEKYYVLKSKYPQIIVLIGPNTSGGGEMTTISFMGKENVQFIGKPTAGFTKGTKSYTLSDGSLLNLCAASCSDRNYTKISGPIQPQEKIEFQLSNEGDSAIEYAKKKFNNKN